MIWFTGGNFRLRLLHISCLCCVAFGVLMICMKHGVWTGLETVIFMKLEAEYGGACGVAYIIESTIERTLYLQVLPLEIV
jgi:hypothetical protein